MAMARPSTAGFQTAESCESIPSEAELLELSGEDSLDQIREIVLRGRGLRDVSQLLAPLTSLEVLSLSDNRLQSISDRLPLTSLTTVNVNFNRMRASWLASPGGARASQVCLLMLALCAQESRLSSHWLRALGCATSMLPQTRSAPWRRCLGSSICVRSRCTAT